MTKSLMSPALALAICVFTAVGSASQESPRSAIAESQNYERPESDGKTDQHPNAQNGGGDEPRESAPSIPSVPSANADQNSTRDNSGDHHQADADQQKAQVPVDVGGSSAIGRPSPSDSGDLSFFYAWLTGWATVTQAATSILAFLFLFFTLLATVRAARAATEANRISREIAAATRRPWVEISDASFEDLRDGGLATIGCRLEIRNVGATPALGIHAHVDFFTVSPANTFEALEAAKASADGMGTIGPGRALFPGRDFSFNQVLDIRPERLEADAIEIAGCKAVYPWLRAVVIYRAAPNGPIFRTIRTFRGMGMDLNKGPITAHVLTQRISDDGDGYAD